MKGTLGRIGLVALATIAFAATAAADPAEPPVVTVNIPAQQAGDALSEFARQSGLQVVFYTEIAEGLQTHALSGTYRLNEALARLLAGTQLRFELLNDRTIAVKGPAVGESTSTRAPDATSQMLLAQNEQGGRVDTPGVAGGDSRGERAQAISNSVPPSGPGTLSGRVMETESGSGLAGAIVRLEGTDHTTRTDELGRFRLSGVPAGEHQLVISYLGLDPVQSTIDVEAGKTVSVDLQVSRADPLNEIVVFGTRSARAKALNIQRTADNSTSVLSSDLLGNFPATTIAEALRRAPGVSTYGDLGAFGQGQNVAIRGMPANMNAVRINGLGVPTLGKNYERIADLSTLLADTVESITINETLLPSHDSAGTGGLIEIETKSPLARPRRYVSFGVEAGEKEDGFGSDRSANATVSGIFGERQSFGLSASIQYLRQEGSSYSFSNEPQLGEYLPLDEFGAPSLSSRQYFDPRLAFPFEPGVSAALPASTMIGSNDVEIDNWNITLSAAWQVTDSTDLRIDALRSSQDSEQFNRQVSLTFPVGYQPLAVAALDGEVRQAAAWDGSASGYHVFGYVPSFKTVTDTLSMRGTTAAGRWEHSYEAGYAQGYSRTRGGLQGFVSLLSAGLPSDPDDPFGPMLLNPAFIAPEAVDPVEQRILSMYGRGGGVSLPLPHLTNAGWSFFNDPNNYGVNGSIGGNTGSGEDRRYSGDLSSRLNLKWRAIEYVEIGANLESARIDSTSDSMSYLYPFGIPLADIGIGFAPLTLTGGRSAGGNYVSLSRASIEGLSSHLAGLPPEGDGTVVAMESFADPRLKKQYLREDSFAAYAQAKIELGRFGLIGGARLNRVAVDNLVLRSPHVYREDGSEDLEFANRFSELVHDEATVTDLLPRLQLNYRQTDNLIFRASYFRSVARPSLVELSLQPQIDLSLYRGDGSFAPTLSVFKGNPGLEPANTDNYDFSVEYYSDNVGVMKLSVFRKRIENVLRLNTFGGLDVLADVDLPDDPYFEDLPDDLVIMGIQPVNSDVPAKHWGYSLSFERQFDFLPRFWSGFGFFGNYTWSSEENPTTYTWFPRPVFDDGGTLVGFDQLTFDVSDDNVVESGTASVTYSQGSIDGSLSYTWQSTTQEGFMPFGLIQVSNQPSSLDFKLQYLFETRAGRYRVYLEGKNLLDGPADAFNMREMSSAAGPTYVYGANFYGGRALLVGVSAAF